jgi:hypothetical protein
MFVVHGLGSTTKEKWIPHTIYLIPYPPFPQHKHTITQPLRILGRMNGGDSAMELVSSFELKNLSRVMLNMQLIPLVDFKYFAKNRDPHLKTTLVWCIKFLILLSSYNIVFSVNPVTRMCD